MIIRTNASAGGGSALPDYFGDGSDGDVVISADTAIDVTLDEGQIIKNYNSLTVNEGCTLKPANRCNGMVLLIKGDLVLNGTISVDKCAPLVNSMEESALSLKQIKLCGALTGGKGGNGGNGNAKYSTVAGGTGGEGYALGGGWAGGGGGLSEDNNNAYAGGNGDRAPIGTTYPYPSTKNSASSYGAGGSAYNSGYYYGGAGPGGSGALARGASFKNGINGDAYPGGAVWVFVGGNVVIGTNGKITASGGNGADGASSSNYGSASGGGGGGGIVALVYAKNYNNAGGICADGGKAGASVDTSGTSSGYEGTSGSAGSIFIRNISDLL